VKSKGPHTRRRIDEPREGFSRCSQLLEGTPCNASLTFSRRGSFDSANTSLREVFSALRMTVSGAWVFRGTRIPVAAVFENLEDGLIINEIVQMFDGLTREQVQAVLDFTAHSLETSTPSR
jgi:uncharacterized protein (DUF433 family)